MRYISGKEINKVLSLYEGNQKEIFNAFSSSKSGEWYKFINDQALLRMITPVQSHLISKIIDTKNDILYGRMVQEENVDRDFLYELETLLQLFGEVMVTWDKLDGVLYPRLYVGKQMDFHETFTGDFLWHKAHEIYTHDMVEYKFEKHYEVLKNGKTRQTNRLFKGEKEVHLNTIWETRNLPKIKIWNNKPAFIFRTNHKLDRVVGLVQLVDEVLSFLSLATRQSAPTIYVSEDLIMENGSDESVDKQYDPVEMLKNRMYGMMKLPYVEERMQKVDLEQPRIETKTYEAVRMIALTEILGIVGISEATWAYDKVGERTSGESIMQRERLTLRTRHSLITERKQALISMYKELGIDTVFDFGNYDVALNGDNLIKLSVVVDKEHLSLRTFLEQGFPLWSEERVTIEMARIEEDKKRNNKEEVKDLIRVEEIENEGSGINNESIE